MIFPAYNILGDESGGEEGKVRVTFKVQQSEIEQERKALLQNNELLNEVSQNPWNVIYRT